MVYPYNDVVVYSNKKEWNAAVCNEIDESHQSSIEQKKNITL